MRSPWKDVGGSRALLLGCAALLSGLYVYYYVFYYRDFLLRSDDAAFVGAARGSPLKWFTQGYLDYFNPYPEWPSLLRTDFLRPVTNVIAYLEHLLLGENYALYFALFFVVQFCGAAVFVSVLRERFAPPCAILGMTLLYLGNPAFVNIGLTGLAFQFDVVAAQLVLAAFLALWRERNGLALVLLTLAVFTKETAVFAPVAAALSLLIWGRDRRLALLMLSPLLLWSGARILAFGNVLGKGLTTPIASAVTGLLVWPTGATPYDVVTTLDFSSAFDRRHLFWLAGILANCALWLFLCYVAFVAGRAQLAASATEGASSRFTASLLVWALGALSIGALVAPLSRYGASYYPFLYLFLTDLFFVSGLRVPRWMPAGVLLIFTAVTLWQLERNLTFSAWQALVAPERALKDALRALPQDGSTVYVVNAPLRYITTPAYLNPAWSLNLRVVIINQVRLCEGATVSGRTRFVRPDLLEVQIPDCADFSFLGISPELIGQAISGTLMRQGVGEYRFPEGVVASPVWGGETSRSGHTLEFRVDPGEHPIVLAYDWVAGSFAKVMPH